MKSRTLASIGAVLLYLYCEFFQASPFHFGGNGPGIPAEEQTQTETRPGSRRDLQTLFQGARLQPPR